MPHVQEFLLPTMKETILLVDDQEIFNFISTKVIQSLGVSAEIRSVLSATDALLLIEDYLLQSRAMPRLVLVDINMPVMDGFAFIEAFQRLEIQGGSKTVLAILSSSLAAKDHDRASELGIEYFLTKPLSETELKKVLTVAGVLSNGVLKI